MFNVNSSPSLSKAYTNALKSDEQPSASNNQIAANIQRIQNLPSGSITTRNIPNEIIIDEIGTYLSTKSVPNLNEAQVCSQLDPFITLGKKYGNQLKKLSEENRDQIIKLLQWEEEGPKGTNENRKEAVIRIVDCILQKNPSLNLNSLNLSSLPDLSPFKFITSINYQGNDLQPLLDCFTQDENAIFKVKLKQSSLLHNNIKHIKANYDGRSQVYSNNLTHATLSPELVAHLGINSFTKIINLKEFDSTWKGENTFMKLSQCTYNSNRHDKIAP